MQRRKFADFDKNGGKDCAAKHNLAGYERSMVIIMKVIFMGTPDFSVGALEALVAADRKSVV